MDSKYCTGVTGNCGQTLLLHFICDTSCLFIFIFYSYSLDDGLGLTDFW